VDDDLLTIGQLARRTQVAPSALRYYEDLGLMPPASRVSGQRRYARSAVELVGVILFLRDVGFSLAEMKVMLATRSQSPDGWRELVRRKLTELEEQIAGSQVATVALEHALRCRHDDPLECPNFGSVVAARLAGKPLQETHTH
jgi:DNA-binding transcriptional MerR regulator